MNPRANFEVNHRQAEREWRRELAEDRADREAAARAEAARTAREARAARERWQALVDVR